MYLAGHQKLSKKFAVKVLYGENASDDEMRKRFFREAELASRLDHPNICSVIDYGETETGILYFVMSYVEGRGLHEVVASDFPLSSRRITTMFTQLCQALAHAHENGVVHRDLKAENIMVAEGAVDRVQVVDFGIAIAHEGAHANRLTTEGIVIGTPAYMAPEQALGGVVDNRTDLFAAGVLLYEMLCGDIPFSGGPGELLAQTLGAPVPAIIERVPGLEVDEKLENIARRLMSKKPTDRYQSAAAVIAEVGGGGRLRRASNALVDFAVRKAKSSVAPTPSPSAKLEKASGPKMWPIIAAVAALFVIGGLAVVKFTGSSETVGNGGITNLEKGESDNQKSVAPALAKAEVPTPVAAVEVPSTDENEGSAKEKAGEDSLPGKSEKTKRKKAQKRSLAKNSRQKKASTSKDLPAAKGSAGSAPVQQPTSQSVQSLYSRVGRQMNALEKSHPQKVGVLRDKYFAIPLSDAIRTPSIRSEVIGRLQRLQRQMKKIEASR